MRIRYIVPFDRKIIIDDHWEIPIQGGKCRVLEKDGFAVSLEIVFEKQPLEYAPHLQTLNEGIVVANITARDPIVIRVLRQLEHAATFLECIHDIGLRTDEIEMAYEGETTEEEALIAIKGLSNSKHEHVLPLSFDMLTRSIMAAETKDGPMFESTLAKDAREAYGKQEYINSFRYSFLLIESLYGEGQFRKSGLEAALKNNPEFYSFIEKTIAEDKPIFKDQSSDTYNLLNSKPTANQLIDHLVEKRGFYFHGNLKRKNAWKHNDQSAAEPLAFICMAIALHISMKAADDIFQYDLSRRHYDDALSAGAKIVYNIKFNFIEPGEKHQRKHQFNISMPGTKPTPRSAFQAAQQFVEYFQQNLPVSQLTQAECTLSGSDKKIFSLKFYFDDQASNSNE